MALAIRYAVDNGAKVINMSSSKHFSGEGETIDNVIVVGSISSNLDKNWKTTSNYGKNNVDIFAPGEDIFATYTQIARKCFPCYLICPVLPQN